MFFCDEVLQKPNIVAVVLWILIILLLLFEFYSCCHQLDFNRALHSSLSPTLSLPTVVALHPFNMLFLSLHYLLKPGRLVFSFSFFYLDSIPSLYQYVPFRLLFSNVHTCTDATYFSDSNNCRYQQENTKLYAHGNIKLIRF